MCSARGGSVLMGCRTWARHARSLRVQALWISAQDDDKEKIRYH
jgi:hypothetical protein